MKQKKNTVSAAGTVKITAVKQYVVNYNIPANVTAKFGGQSVSGENSVVVDAGTYSAEVSANTGYILKAVTANGTPLTGSNGTYSVAVNSDITLEAEVIDPINVDNSKVVGKYYYQETVAQTGEILRGVRINFKQDIAEIAAITGGNYGITMTGKVSLTINGAAASPTSYSYFGLIDGAQHQSLEARFDTTQWKNGDKLVIEAGTYFYLPEVDTYIYFDEAVSVENYTVTLSGNTNRVSVTADNEYLQNGEKVTGNTALSSGAMVLKGTTLTVTANNNYKINSITATGADDNGNYTYTVTGATTLNISTSYNSCIVEGTMITLADGTQKAVEDLTYSDKLLAFNHLTGKVEAADMAVLGHENMPAQQTTVITASFSDGTILRIAYSHGLYDMTLNQYVFLTEGNAYEFIGHIFYATEYINGEFVEKTVVLTDIDITQEIVRIFSPSSMEYMNCFAEGLLNVTATLFNRGEFVNMFEFDEDLKYNEEAMKVDIEKYGLYTYEDFKEYMPYEMFERLPFDVLKVSVGKGLITWDEILVMIDDLHHQSGVIR